MSYMTSGTSHNKNVCSLVQEWCVGFTPEEVWIKGMAAEICFFLPLSAAGVHCPLMTAYDSALYHLDVNSRYLLE